MHRALEQHAPPGSHPEVAIGIPKIVITAKGLAAKAKYAAYVSYQGPLTLDGAITAGFVSASEAGELIRAWEQETGWTWAPVAEQVS